MGLQSVSGGSVGWSLFGGQWVGGSVIRSIRHSASQSGSVGWSMGCCLVVHCLLVGRWLGGRSVGWWDASQSYHQWVDQWVISQSVDQSVVRHMTIA